MTKIWGLVRHGTRLPGDSIIDKMRNYLPTLQKQIVDNFLSDKSQLCDISKMKAWTPQVSLKDEEKSLTKEGQRELFALAQRLKNRFPTLLGQEFRNETFFVSFYYYSRIDLYLAQKLNAIITHIQQKKKDKASRKVL